MASAFRRLVDADSAGDEAWTLEPGATATWNAVLPAGADVYDVYARWDLLDPEGNAGPPTVQAAYAITHASGTTTVIRDQKPELDDEGPGYMDPQGWVLLGRYTFDGSGQVVLTHSTQRSRQLDHRRPGQVRRATRKVVVERLALDSWYTANGPDTIGPGEYVVIAERNLVAFGPALRRRRQQHSRRGRLHRQLGQWR